MYMMNSVHCAPQSNVLRARIKWNVVTIRLAFPYDRADPLLGIRTKTWKRGPKRRRIPTCTTALFLTVEGGATRVPTDGWVDEQMWSTHTTEYYPALKRTGIPAHATMQGNLEATTLNGMHQTRGMNTMWFYLSEVPGIAPFRHRKLTSGCQGLRERGGWAVSVWRVQSSTLGWPHRSGGGWRWWQQNSANVLSAAHLHT